MRRRTTNDGVTLQAIAGNHAVLLAFDLAPEARPECLGFGVHRVDHTENEQYWLSGFKTFKSVVPIPNPAQRYSTQDHPIQSFYWGDYSAKPGHTYTYRIVPRYGRPKNLRSESGVEARLEISTNDPNQGTHGVFFNRGTAASQQYAHEFDLPPGKLSGKDRDRAMQWLSRGLLEAILAFIGQASSARFALRAAVYEFTQTEILAKFKEADTNGADVKIVYHARDDETGKANRQAIAAAGLPDSMLIERTKAPIAHNKFIVLCTKNADGTLVPIAVWTGSTNLSDGGIYGHSNVGHAVRDPTVASQFFSLWSQLQRNPEPATLRDWVAANSPCDANMLSTNGIHTVFSPRHGAALLDWYAQEFGVPALSSHITLPFGMGKAFEDQLEAYGGPALHFVLLDKRDKNQAEWATSPRVLVAVGTSGGPDSLKRWAHENLTGFNKWVPYVHTKILLVDPVAADPLVISGSANFSPASTSSNDENMLIIRGAPDVADVYLTEYARMFNHFYSRYWASQLKNPDAAETRSFLDETPAWQTPYFTDGNPKDLQRVLLSSQVEGNT